MAQRSFVHICTQIVRGTNRRGDISAFLWKLDELEANYPSLKSQMELIELSEVACGIAAICHIPTVKSKRAVQLYQINCRNFEPILVRMAQLQIAPSAESPKDQDHLIAIRSCSLKTLIDAGSEDGFNILKTFDRTPWIDTWIRRHVENHELWKTVTAYISQDSTDDLQLLMRMETHGLAKALVHFFSLTKQSDNVCECGYQFMSAILPFLDDLPTFPLQLLEEGLIETLLENIPPVSAWKQSAIHQKIAHTSWAILGKFIVSVPAVKEQMLAYPASGSHWDTLYQGWEYEAVSTTCYCDVNVLYMLTQEPEIARHLRDVVRFPQKYPDDLISKFETIAFRLGITFEAASPLIKAVKGKRKARSRRLLLKADAFADTIYDVLEAPAITPAVERTAPPDDRNKSKAAAMALPPPLTRCGLFGPCKDDWCCHDTSARAIRSHEKYVTIECARGCVTHFHHNACFLSWTRRTADERPGSGWSFWEKLRTQGSPKPGTHMPRRIDPVSHAEYVFLECPTDGCAAHVTSVRKCLAGAPPEILLGGIPIQLAPPKAGNGPGKYSSEPKRKAPKVSSIAVHELETSSSRADAGTIRIRNYVPHTPVMAAETRGAALSVETPSSHDAAPIDEWKEQLTSLFFGHPDDRPKPAPAPTMPRRPDFTKDLDAEFPLPVTSEPLPTSHPFDGWEALPSQTAIVGLYRLPVEAILRKADRCESSDDIVRAYIVDRLRCWGVTPSDVFYSAAHRAAAIKTRDAETGYKIRQRLRTELWIDQTVLTVTLKGVPETFGTPM